MTKKVANEQLPEGKESVYLGKSTISDQQSASSAQGEVPPMERANGEWHAMYQMLKKENARLSRNIADIIDGRHKLDIQFALEAKLTQLRAELEEAKEQRLQCGHPATYGFGTYCAICERDTLRSDLAIAREALRRAVEAMPDWDCGSNSCRFAKIKGGMRTNGGCTCLEEIRNAPKARMVFARIASVLGTLTTKEGKADV